MNIEFTGVDTGYACSELGIALERMVPEIRMFVNKKYSSRKDDRTLVIVMVCPCCSSSDKLRIRNSIMVSPFRGIDCSGYNIKRINVYPPFRTPGKDGEAGNVEEFLKFFENTIEEALK
ncbi:MAG: hypothetical protein UR99_C0063G0009 [Candidatus Moranbacteria bacterium GW2011_GWD2_36_12]|nr:MAG: hypothetical protein UR99_C0063G0009 [Candidatus Moranbacteria bacterium GW2011_GWD2_36_12]KKQ04581.1 MAG: hypothetical protein US16_C0054G0009 [Candidatus Moranbacteria bacterium GW2011_GWE2_36_40]